jgi:hypothetical protein
MRFIEQSGPAVATDPGVMLRTEISWDGLKLHSRNCGTHGQGASESTLGPKNGQAMI